MKLHGKLIATGLCFIFLFIAFTFLVRTDILRGVDFDITVKLQGRLPERSYSIFNFISQPVGFFPMTILLIATFALMRDWIRLIIAFAAYGGGHVLELVGKLILSQPPPQYMFYKLPTNAWFPNDYRPEGNSYPSGHSFRAFFYAMLLVFILMKTDKISRNLKIILVCCIFVVAGIIAVGKIALGQHWATDVIAGFMLGIGSALTASAIEINSTRKSIDIKT